jgi:hypothetical protein
MAATPAAHACSCAGPAPPDIAMKRADAVFNGTVISTDSNMLDFSGGNWLRKAVLFAVTTVFKGTPQSQVILQVYESCCGYQEIWFANDETYLVYVETNSDGKQYTAYASGTKPLAQVGADFPVLGQAKPPSQSVDLRNRFFLQSDGFLLMAIVVVVLAGWGLIKLVRPARTDKHAAS